MESKHFIFKYTLVTLSIGVLLSVLFGLLMRRPLEINYFFIGSVIFFAFAVLVAIFKNRVFLKIATTILLLIFGILVGFSRYSDDYLEHSSTLENLNNQEVILTGEIVYPAVKKGWQKEVVVKIESISDKEYIGYERVLAKLHFAEQGELKDIVKLHGKLQIPESFVTDSGREFDYESYLLNRKITMILNDAEVVRIEEYSGFSLWRTLLSVRNRFIKSIEKWLPLPESALSVGMVVGVQGTLGGDLDRAFRDTGLSHIVVLSGYNISIVVDALLRGIRLLGGSFTGGSIAGIIGIILFAMLVGGGSTVIRASIMAGMVIIARYFGRPHTAGRGLLYAATIMVLVSPRVLLHDLSFQLSFIATLGLIYLAPIIESWIKAKGRWRYLVELFSVTLAAQISVMPLLAYSIGSASLISLFANLIVLPFVPFAMAWSFVLFLLDLVGIGFIWAPPTFWIHRAITWSTETLASVPWASVYVPEIGVIAVIGIYAVMIGMIVRWYKKDLRKKERS